jgi:2-desacetyl-2-hydroxyethyl bacteriochlorophyllide A dehydrogenase
MRDRTMRAAVIAGPGTIRVVDVAAPAPGPGQVQVRLSGCGVCGSNLPVWEGRPWFSYPLEAGAPGHEGWGRIEQLGEGVLDLRAGDRIAMLSQRAFAELDIADASHVVRLPASFSELPFPAEAVACGVNVMRRTGIMAGQRVAVVGVGFLGAVLVRLAALAGADVTAITRRRYALDVAATLGARHLVRLGDVWQTINEAKAANHDKAFDVALEVTGLQGPLDVASHLTATRGRLVIAGYHQDGPRQIDMQTWNWNGIDVVNAHERDPQVYVEGMRQAVALVDSGALRLETLVTHVFPIDAAAEAFRCAVERPDGFLKAAVVTHA